MNVCLHIWITKVIGTYIAISENKVVVQPCDCSVNIYKNAWAAHSFNEFDCQSLRRSEIIVLQIDKFEETTKLQAILKLAESRAGFANICNVFCLVHTLKCAFCKKRRNDLLFFTKFRASWCLKGLLSCLPFTSSSACTSGRNPWICYDETSFKKCQFGGWIIFHDFWTW